MYWDRWYGLQAVGRRGVYAPFECFLHHKWRTSRRPESRTTDKQTLGALLLNQLPLCFKAWGIYFPDIYASRK